MMRFPSRPSISAALFFGLGFAIFLLPLALAIMSFISPNIERDGPTSGGQIMIGGLIILEILVPLAIFPFAAATSGMVFGERIFSFRLELGAEPFLLTGANIGLLASTLASLAYTLLAIIWMFMVTMPRPYEFIPGILPMLGLGFVVLVTSIIPAACMGMCIGQLIWKIQCMKHKKSLRFDDMGP